MKYSFTLLMILGMSYGIYAQDIPTPTHTLMTAPDADPNLPSVAYKEEMDAFHLLAKQNNGVSRQDSTHEFEWNITTSQWDLSRRLFFAYNTDQDPTTLLVKRLNGGLWVNYYLYTYMYDANSNLIKYTEQLWNGSGWNNVYQSIYSYDANDNETEEIVQTWSAGVWKNLVQLTYTYDGLHNIITQIISDWVSTAWVKDIKREYTYDTNNLITYQLRQDWDAAWKNAFQYFYTYDTLLNLVDYRSEISTNGNWTNNFRNSYDYDEHNNRILLQRLNWVSGNFWTFDYQFIYTYDEFNNQLSETEQSFNGNTWDNVDNLTYAYNTEKNQISEVYQEWNGSWTKIDSSYYFYNEITGFSEQGVFSEIELYPNPASAFININTEYAFDKDITLEIFSREGLKVIEVRSKQLQGKSVDVSQLTVGMYYVLIHHEYGTSLRKFIKI